MPSVYILITRTNTMFSRGIGLVTGAEFTHVSLALDRELTHMYSFARRFDRIPFFASLVRESLERGVYGRNSNAPAALFELEMSDAAYGRMMRRLSSMLCEAGRYRYNVLGLWGYLRRKPRHKPYHYFCSQFVSELLGEAGALALPCDPALICPKRFRSHARSSPSLSRAAAFLQYSASAQHPIAAHLRLRLEKRQGRLRRTNAAQMLIQEIPNVRHPHAPL